MKSDLYARLLDICEDQKLPRMNKHIMELTGLSSGRVSQLKKGDPDASISEEAMGRLTELGYSRAWIKHGTGPMRPSGGMVATEPSADFVPIQRVHIQVSAGVTGFSVEHLHGNGAPVFFRADWIKAKGYKAERLYALKVSGESMEPGLWDGDLVVINSADTTPTDGEVFVANYEGEVVIKRLERNAGEWWLTSDNPRFKPKKCDEHAELLGRVIYKQSEKI